MGVDDFIDIFLVDIGIPSALRIDDDHRAFFAPLQASSLVDAHFAGAGQVELLDAFFRMFLGGLGTLVGAAGALTGLALVEAEENVMFVERGVCHDEQGDEEGKAL